MADTIQVREWFKEYNFTGSSTVTDWVERGVLKRLDVAPGDYMRHIWIAAGAYFQNAAVDHWWVCGCLNFYRDGTKVGCLQFSDASADITDAERDAAPFKLTRLRPDATGSTQPGIKYQRSSVAVVRNNLDMGAFAIRADCDAIDYTVEGSYYDTSSGVGPIQFLLGFRVMSSLPN